VLHLHIAKREGQCIYGSVDLGKERLLIVFIHFLEVNTCLMTKDEKRRVWNENITNLYLDYYMDIGLL